MSNPTSNFGWQMPTPTDLVTDLPADFEVFGQAVDTSMADLKGGTTGQILSKATNTDMDFVWITNDQGDITGITATSPLTGGGTSGAVTVGIQSASTSQSGAVQLSDSTSTTSSVLAATPTAVKSAYDLANAAIPKSTVTAKGSIVAASASSTPANLSVGANGTTLVADSGQSTGLGWVAKPSSSNPVLNSAFNVWQRGTSFASGAFAYTADRWCFNTGGATAYTASRQATNDTTNLPFIQYCFRWARNSGATGVNTFVNQSMEIANSTAFAGKTITYSFYARVGAGNTQNLKAQLFTQTSASDLNVNVSGTWTAIIDTIFSATTTWARYSYTVAVGATATQIALGWNFATAATSAIATDYVEVTGVQIDIGSVALPFRSAGTTYQQELAACQRYYFRINNAAESTNALFGYGAAFSTTLGSIPMILPTTMRIKPTVLDYPTVGTYLQLADPAGTTTALTALTSNSALSTTNSVWLEATVASGLTQNRPYFLRGASSTSAYLGISAEL